MTRELLDTLLALAVVAIAGGTVCAVLYLLGRGRSGTVPGAAPESARWSGGDVLLAFFLYLMCGSLVSSAFLGEPRSFLTEPGELLKMTRAVFWVSIASAPLVVTVVLLAFYFLRGIRPAQTGFTADRIGQNVVFAYAAWLAISLPVLLIFYVISTLVPVQPHPFQILAKLGGEPIDWVLFLLSAVVMAPLVEELLFRGVLLRWLMRAGRDGHIGVAVASLLLVMPWGMIVDALLPRPNQAVEFSRWGDPKVPNWAGTLFVIALWPGYGWLLYKVHRADTPLAAERLNALASIYGSALLFAVFHQSVWPSPIPLFFFGLGIGWVAHRSGNLVGPITVHALFNAVACAEVMLGALRNLGS